MAVQAFAKPSGRIVPPGRKAASTGTGREAGVMAVKDMPSAPSLVLPPLRALAHRMVYAPVTHCLFNAPRTTLSMGDLPHAPVQASQARTAANTARTRLHSRPFIMEVIPVAAPARPGATPGGSPARSASRLMAGALDMVKPCRERSLVPAGPLASRPEGRAHSGRTASPRQQSQNQIGRM